MTPFTLEISETIPCYSCKTPVIAGEDQICQGCGTVSHAMPFDAFFAMLERGEIIHAKNGGYVIGRNSPDDDIPMFRYAGGGHFQLLGVMQGGEYLMGIDASVRHVRRLHEINNEVGRWRPKSAIPLTDATVVINTNFVSPSPYLWIQTGQFIINRFATAKHFAELERLNFSRG